MCKDIYNIDQLKRMLTPVFFCYGVKSAILFGSYGKGAPTPESDIDLLVDSRLKGLQFVALLEEIREITDKSVDLLDITHVNSGSEIENEIKKTGVLIYER